MKQQRDQQRVVEGYRPTPPTPTPPDGQLPKPPPLVKPALMNAAGSLDRTAPLSLAAMKRRAGG
jgi:hypothetical protein